MERILLGTFHRVQVQDVLSFHHLLNRKSININIVYDFYLLGCFTQSKYINRYKFKLSLAYYINTFSLPLYYHCFNV